MALRRLPKPRPCFPALSALLVLGALMLGSRAEAATLKPYRSEAEFAGALQAWSEQVRPRRAEFRREASPLGLGGAVAMAPSAAMAQDAASARASAAAPESTQEGITNVQTAGVDEGGIVKQAGDFLIVLRRGRLFTVRAGGGQLQAVAALDAYAPGSDPADAWYDELLVSGRQVVVIGYSYARGGTEIGLFELGRDGRLAYQATYHLRSHDYWSSRNYASRLVGSQLVFYTPTVLAPWGPAVAEMLPALRRWRAGVPDDFERILPATRIYRTDDDFPPGEALALHTVTRCELGQTPLRCEATAVLGPAGRVFYVSANSVYVWTSRVQRNWPPMPHGRAEPERWLSAVFRLPLDGAAPSGLKAAGVPIDAMSFLEDGHAHLNVLLREFGEGEGMSGAERGSGALALLRVPLSAFGDGRGAAPREAYRRLPGLAAGASQNRYVGDWLLWGGDAAEAFALAYARTAPAVALAPAHGVERIEALGEHALLVGSGGGELRFTAVQLSGSGRQPRLAGRQGLPGMQQGEARSHGFFYRSQGGDRGILGLPVVASGERSRWRPARAAPAAVVFLKHDALSFVALGQLSARAARGEDDGCKASCTDWYGNARPIFLGDRVLALMGYEIVEGRIVDAGGDARIEERRRISFAPLARWRGERPSPFE